MAKLAAVLLIFLAVTLPQTAQAQSSRVAVLSLTSVEAAFATWMLPELERSGLVRGRNLTVDLRHGSLSELPAIARDIMRERPDVVVAVSSAALAAIKAASPDVPVVTAGADPVGLGYATSFARPGGTVTGFVVSGAELDAKRLDILAQILGTKSLGSGLLLTDFPANVLIRQSMTDIAGRLGLDIVFAYAAGEPDYQAALTKLRAAGVRGTVVTTNPVFFRDTKVIADTAATIGIATICEWPDSAERGCFIGYGPTRADLYTGVTRIVIQILRGTKAGDIPIEAPARFELAINLAVARRIGVEIGPDLMARADRLIE